MTWRTKKEATLCVVWFILLVLPFTVILDCCHSGSGTRGGHVVRGVEFKERRVTVPGNYDEGIWRKFIGSGTVVDYEYRHAGPGSHVLLAACGSKELAADGYSFTQALLEYLKTALLDTLSYVVLIRNIDPETRLLYVTEHLLNP